MQNINQTKALEIARARGLEVKEITYGMNGCPQGLGDRAVIGFENFEDAKAFATEVGGIVSHFETKNGWYFWLNKGQAIEPYTNNDYLNDLGDNYSVVDGSDLDDVKEPLKDLVENFDGDFTAIEDFIKMKKELAEEIENAEEDEVVISSHGRYFETVKKTNMGYHEDTSTYAIGVLLSHVMNEDE